MKDKGRRSRRKQGKPSDHGIGLSPVKGKQERRGIGQEELLTAVPFSRRLPKAEENSQKNTLLEEARNGQE